MAQCVLQRFTKPADDLPYLCFTAEDISDIAFKKVGTGWVSEPNMLEYSTNGIAWGKYNWGQVIILGKGKFCYFRCISNGDGLSQDNDNYIQFHSTAKVRCSGNIMSLIDNSCNSKVIKNSFCFSNLFSKCMITSLPELPAEVITDYCYSGMFCDCKYLKYLPSNLLPAINLTEGCYKEMFKGCPNIRLSDISTTGSELFRIPSVGEGILSIDSMKDMFADTGGLFVGTPEINKNYYLIDYDYKKKDSILTINKAPYIKDDNVVTIL